MVDEDRLAVTDVVLEDQLVGHAGNDLVPAVTDDVVVLAGVLCSCDGFGFHGCVV